MRQYTQKSNYETVHFEGEWIILNTEDFTITKLNETGGFCWSLLDQLQSLETLTDAFSQQFILESEDLKEDIKLFLEGLMECGLVKSIN